MDPKFELENSARKLISTSPEKAVDLYFKLFSSFPDSVNEWDAFFTLSAMRNSEVYDLKMAHDLVNRFRCEKVSNVYGWLIFDKCIKSRSSNEIIKNEGFITELPTLSPQKNLFIDDKFPCPTTISVFKLCDAHSENLFNARKIHELLSLLDYKLLSKKGRTIESTNHDKIEFPSDLEKYFAMMSKALFKLGKYKECITNCTSALEEISDFHYDNDCWFKMRIALSEGKLGNQEQSMLMLQNLLLSKTGKDKWFLYRDLAMGYYEQADFLNAWKYSVDASFFGNEPQYMIGLYLLQARILFKLNRENDGKLLAELIAAILNEQKWGKKPEYDKIILYYKIDEHSLRPLTKITKDVKEFFLAERYKEKKRIRGKVISVRNNGKGGRIKYDNGLIADFNRKDLVVRPKTCMDLMNSMVEFFLMDSVDGKKVAENISIIESDKTVKADLIIGSVCEGTVMNIAEFGVFVRIMGGKDGLLHKNNLPDDMRSDFKNKFTKGEQVKVIIVKVTEKGPQLKLVDNKCLSNK